MSEEKDSHSEDRFVFKPIGIIHSPYKSNYKTPRQAYLSDDFGEIEVFPEYEDGLKDIDGFSHIIILYFFHKSEGYSLHVTPFLDSQLRGVFATKAPRRPNPIGLSTVRLMNRSDNKLKVQGLDVIDGTPLLDIKPWVPTFDEKEIEGVKIGWLTDKVDERGKTVSKS